MGSCWTEIFRGLSPGLLLKSDGKSRSQFWMHRSETTFLGENGAEGKWVQYFGAGVGSGMKGMC